VLIYPHTVGRIFLVASRRSKLAKRGKEKQATETFEDVGNGQKCCLHVGQSDESNSSSWWISEQKEGVSSFCMHVIV
jgi:hypothetical protein